MKRPRVYFLLLILCALLSATQARAIEYPTPDEAIGDINQILNDLEAAGIVPADVGNSINDVEDILTCIDTANDELKVMSCFEKFNKTYIGQMLLAGVPSWFWDLLDVYIDLRTLNVADLIIKVGEAAVCALAQVLLSGTDICAIIQEFIDIGKDVAALVGAVETFFEDVGEAAYNWAKCKFKPSSCEHHLTGQEIAWRDFFANILASNQGRYWRETPPYSNYCMAAAPVGGQASSFCPQDYFMDHYLGQVAAARQVIHTDGDYSTTHDSDIDNAASQFLQAVNKQWDADVMDPANGLLKTVSTARQKFIDTQSEVAVHAVLTAPDDSAVRSASALQNAMTNWCVTNFKAQAQKTVIATVPAFPGAPASQTTNVMLAPVMEELDFWITVPSTMTATQKAPLFTTQDWCQNSFYLNRKSLALTQMFAQHLVSDLKCETSGNANGANQAVKDLWCPTEEAGTRCQETMASLALGAASPVQCHTKPQCPTHGGVYYCTETLTYNECLSWVLAKGTGSPTKVCQFSTASEGPLMAAEIRFSLKKGMMQPGSEGTPSKYAAFCSIDGKPGEVKASQANRPMASVPAGSVQNMAGVMAGQGGSTSQGGGTKMKLPLGELNYFPQTEPSMLDCPRPTLKHFCEIHAQKAQANYPVPMVACTAKQVDAGYQKLMGQVAAYAQANPQLQTGYDPLVLTGKITACPPGFSCIRTLTPTVDGVETPTIVMTGPVEAPHSPVGQANLPSQGQLNQMGGARGNDTLPAVQLSKPNAGNGATAAMLNPALRPLSPPPQAGTAKPVEMNPAAASELNQALTSNLTGVAGFDQISGVWKNLPILPAPNGKCGCAATYQQITAISQHAANLMQAGDKISAALTAGKLAAPTVVKANQGLDDISGQLRALLKQRRALAPGYVIQLNEPNKTVR